MVASSHPHYLTFTLLTYPHPEHRVQVMGSVDDVTITSTHTNTSAVNKNIQPYLHKVIAWTKHNHLPKSRHNNVYSVHCRPYRIYEQSGRQSNNTAPPMATHRKVLGLTLDQKITATYKAVMRPALEYASSIWSPIASSTSINKLQVMQNAPLRTATGYTQDE